VHLFCVLVCVMWNCESIWTVCSL